MFRLFILDNGLDKLSGHHFNQAKGLIRGATELGYQPIIFCGKTGESIPEIAQIAIPTFHKILYRPDPFLDIKEHALQFAQECEQCLPELDSSDVLLFPNANYDEIRGLAQWIEKRKITQKIILRLLYYPHEHETDYFECLDLLKPHTNVKLVTSSIPYSNWLRSAGYENYWIGGPPHNLPYIKTQKPPQEYQYEFASLGSAALGKGFVVVLEALLMGLRQGYTPKTLLHTKGFTLPSDLISKLSHVTFIPGNIPEDEFYEQLTSTKCLLTYYHPANYKYQDSAIVTEALAMERYVICSPIAFISDTYGDEAFQFICTPGEYDKEALLNKMKLISAQDQKPGCLLAASQKAKLLSSPTIFIAKVLSL